MPVPAFTVTFPPPHGLNRRGSHVASRHVLGLNHGHGRAQPTGHPLDCGPSGISRQIHEPGQGRGGQDAQDHDDDHEFNEGETFLITHVNLLVYKIWISSRS